MKEDTMICVKDGAAGIYLPSLFVLSCDRDQLVAAGAAIEDLDVVVKGPDEEHYWEAWDNLVQNLSYEENGHDWSFYQDGDLFAVRDDHDWDSDN